MENKRGEAERENGSGVTVLGVRTDHNGHNPRRHSGFLRYASYGNQLQGPILFLLLLLLALSILVLILFTFIFAYLPCLVLEKVLENLGRFRISISSFL